MPGRVPVSSPSPPLAGSIWFLPRRDEVSDSDAPFNPRLPPSEAFNHPVVVLSRSNEINGHVDILKITSFGGSTLSDRFPRSFKRRRQFLPIHPSDPHPDSGIFLSLAEGKMDKRSYINISDVFRVPFQILRRVRNGTRPRLTSSSYDKLASIRRKYRYDTSNLVTATTSLPNDMDETPYPELALLNAPLISSYGTLSGQPSSPLQSWSGRTFQSAEPGPYYPSSPAFQQPRPLVGQESYTLPIRDLPIHRRRQEVPIRSIIQEWLPTWGTILTWASIALCLYGICYLTYLAAQAGMVMVASLGHWLGPLPDRIAGKISDVVQFVGQWLSRKMRLGLG
ncbi:hypothetical protein SODALDRAFT_326806 [Sodiomyces alkalinus F11]|uniref:Uncharacterized protein n=1 Tax=Sodiomyces alkalinus (strain CBS 110278 / VKM F-3762 / F11) TaxID=1314773 RepID=A0A3N2Q7I9_SODAK|nr:hypothetical protein SODALDRAFT_326806 [Sodiomyces alkalinus F11]ROT42647.1 hypothetical protein SODALDRAFT_326806 [Sodiomyces alkalinus F11]